MPQHNHIVNANNNTSGAVASPSQAFLSQATDGGRTELPLYASSLANPSTLNPNAVQFAGNSQGHPNIQPTLAINYIIALQGIFPSRD
jgi:microcystin-dependent protein